MSGGRLVVLDRSGRAGKHFALADGLATLGSDPGCDICVLQPEVSPHHATVVVHHSQTVVRNVGGGDTLVNGVPVSVAALNHGDVLTLGERALRWEYSDPHRRPLHGPLPTLTGAKRGARAARGRRGGSMAAAPARDRAVQLAIELRHRASMPGSTGGKQVAIVQPQRRDTSLQVDNRPGRASPSSANRRAPLSPLSSVGVGGGLHATQASLWIESRKAAPRRPARPSLPARKATPLRLTVLKRAQSAHKIIKIQAPLSIDHTKQAALMLMAGHTPKSKLSVSPQNRSSKKSPSFLIQKHSPVRKTPRGKGRQSGRSSKEDGSSVAATPARGSSIAQDSSNRRSSKRHSGNRSVTVLEITDSTRASDASTRSRNTSLKSPTSRNPRKSAMKDHSKTSTRKTESIKFDLTNLESRRDSSDDTDITRCDSVSDDDLTLHYSESSNQSASPRKSVNSTRSRTSGKPAPTPSPTVSWRTLTLESPRARRSIRGSAGQNALETSALSDYTKAEQSADATVASAFRTRTLSPRSNTNLESYSVVDLVSMDSNDTAKSVYNSADSSNITAYGTPNVSGRKTRSTINPTLGTSTPYVGRTRATRSKSGSNVTRNRSTGSSASTRRSKSLSTPENKQISVNNTGLSRASRSRSRINDSDLLLLDETEVEDSSPKSSKRARTTKSTAKDTSNVNMTADSPGSRGDISNDNSKLSLTGNSPKRQGIITPENRYSPEAAGTPVLSIQSLLDSSRSSLTSQNSGRRGRSADYRRKTLGVLSERKTRQGWKSKSLGSSLRKTLLRLSRDSDSDKTDEGAPRPDNDDKVTPKSAVKITPEAVKNKHSSAKKPQSKRSIIDDLNQSDIVKQLFNSPVKRKLSQSISEFSRKQLFDDDDIVRARRPTRNTVALSGRTPNNSVLERTAPITPERFVSPLNTPSNSPNLGGLTRLFKKNTPDNDLRNVRGVKGLLRTPRTRRSLKNDLTDVRGVKAVFAKSPRNRLSDVRVKEVFAAHAVSPDNDLRRVSGVKSLFKSKSPKNDLTDVRGVRKMFKKKSPENDLRNVSGVKTTLRNASPRNDLTDVRGVRRVFGHQKQKENYHDVSGVEELFNESNRSATRSETMFDELFGKPTIRSVYSKTFSSKSSPKPKTRKGKSLHSSINITTNNVEEWLEREMQKRLHRDAAPSTSRANNSKNLTDTELQKLSTDTVAGAAPVRADWSRRSSSRGKRSASQVYSAHTLPIKKRSIADALEKSKHQLPIKKRLVVHSTPVKGQASTTMNASELGRVSPIAAVDVTRALRHDTSATRSSRMIIEDEPEAKLVKPRTPRKQETPKKSISPNPCRQNLAKSRALRNARLEIVNPTKYQLIRRRTKKN